jgi:hypothetical protein
MTIAQTDQSTRQKPLRLWPGLVIAMLQLLAWAVLPVVAPDAGAFAAIGGVVGGLGIVVWWAIFSRAPRLERWGAVGLMIVGLIATRPFLHESIATGGWECCSSSTPSLS